MILSSAKAFQGKPHSYFMVESGIRETMHPNAFLKKIRNVHCGLLARTKILVLLENQGFNASKIAKESGLSYAVVTYHLKLLKNDSSVERKGTRPYVWLTTGLGQKRLS